MGRRQVNVVLIRAVLTRVVDYTAVKSIVVMPLEHPVRNLVVVEEGEKEILIILLIIQTIITTTMTIYPKEYHED